MERRNKKAIRKRPAEPRSDRKQNQQTKIRQNAESMDAAR